MFVNSLVHLVLKRDIAGSVLAEDFNIGFSWKGTDPKQHEMENQP